MFSLVVIKYYLVLPPDRLFDPEDLLGEVLLEGDVERLGLDERVLVGAVVLLLRDGLTCLLGVVLLEGDVVRLGLDERVLVGAVVLLLRDGLTCLLGVVLLEGDVVDLEGELFVRLGETFEPLLTFRVVVLLG